MKRYLKALNDRDDPEHGVAILCFIYVVGGAMFGLLVLAAFFGARL